MGYKGEVPAIHRGDIDVHLDEGPGVVYWINMVITTSDGNLRLRDGSDTSGDVLIRIELFTGRPGMTRFDPPLPYKKGLYVECVDSIEEFTIAFDHLEK